MKIYTLICDQCGKEQTDLPDRGNITWIHFGEIDLCSPECLTEFRKRKPRCGLDPKDT